jgi:hypothetical protein
MSLAPQAFGRRSVSEGGWIRAENAERSEVFEA